MNLNEIREEIDAIDRQMVALFMRRMDCARQVAEYKLENGMPIFHPEREKQVLDRVEQSAGCYGSSARQLYAAIMELSRALQHDLLGSGEALFHHIQSAEREIPFRSSDISLCCFGVGGSYTHQAAQTFFPHVTPSFCPTFQEVFSAIQDDQADFGIVPIENSSAGSVTDVYDLMLRYRFSIAAELHLPVCHCLAAAPGISIDDITTVYSHPQALAQCSEMLHARGWKKQEAPSTAAAASMAAESSDRHSAVICSEQAAELYGLNILQKGFQNDPMNRTRFLVISKRLYIAPDANKISLCFSLPHTTGSLYNVLCRFAADGLNLTKIESRPICGKAFEYLFYLDFIGHVSEKRTLALLRALSDELPEFSFLGNYPGG